MLKYIGDGSAFADVPACDIEDDELTDVLARSGHTVDSLLASGLYVSPDAKETGSKPTVEKVIETISVDTVSSPHGDEIQRPAEEPLPPLPFEPTHEDAHPQEEHSLSNIEL